jgi:RHH-type proline utilization regulon transcriptional repressor/proline dehydrogenase/delta 1-pyrroline-5-carboxylate dehydrogenase
VGEIYQPFVERLTEAAKSVKIGPAENPENFFGPVVDQKARESIESYLTIAREEGEILYQCDVPSAGTYVPLTIVGNITLAHRLAQEEIFGPVLSVMRVQDFDQALAWANDSPYGLTGSIFSRSPHHLQRGRSECDVGNLYLNRGCTGALVSRQPFGGIRLSGIGFKAGGPDYLLQFLESRTISENTIRHGYSPIQIA